MNLDPGLVLHTPGCGVPGSLLIFLIFYTQSPVLLLFRSKTPNKGTDPANKTTGNVKRTGTGSCRVTRSTGAAAAVNLDA